MARDVNLILDSGSTITANGQTTAIDTEGGFYAIVRELFGAITGTSPTLDTDLEVSIDGGSNYFKVASIPQLVGTDDDIEIARVAYIPRPASGQTVTKVRLSDVVSGTSPSFARTNSYLEPLVSLAVPAIDEGLSQGLAALT